MDPNSTFGNASALCASLTPIWDANTDTCSRAVASVHLAIDYAVDPTSGAATIVAAIASVGFTSFVLPVVDTLINQEFSVVWSMQNETQPPRRKSGNPGYQIGAPLLFGTYLSSPALAVAQFPYDPAAPLLGGGFSLPRDALDPDPSDAAGVPACIENFTSPTAAGRVAVTFGEDALAGCTLYLSRGDLGPDGCAGVRARAEAVLTAGGRVGGAVDRVGKFGNANSTVVGDWVPVIVQELGDKSALNEAPGICTSVLTALDLQFITANLGSALNPQPAIVAARVLKTYAPLRHRCLSPADCRPASAAASTAATLAPQRFRLRASVAFLDLSAVPAPAAAIAAAAAGLPAFAPQAFYPPAPAILPNLPDDLFYPFSLPLASAPAGARSWSALALVSVLQMLVAALVMGGVLGF
ncbi:Tectonic-2 [Cladochytrium tenue]|nr:Tectonic-2 [Cladochytrium tenue]